MRKYRVITKWLCLFAIVPFLLFMASCSDCTSCKVSQPTASIPLCGAAGVALNSTVTAAFSEAMDPSSINGTSFKVTGPGTTAVPGTVAYNATNYVATFTPASNLAFDTTYLITITSAARSSLGVGAIGSTCSFTTGLGPAPTVTATTPTCGVTGVPVNFTPITVTFSEAMNPNTINGTSLTVAGPGTTAIAGSVAYTAATDTAQFTPAGALPYNTLITITVTTAVKSASGTPMAANFTCGFTTAPPPAPVVTATTPTCGVTGVPVDFTPITVTFSEAMNPSTINGTSLTVAGPGTTAIAGSVAYTAATDTAQFTPAGALPFNTLITITVTTAAKSASGTPMAANFTCGFTTAPPPAPTVVSTTPGCGVVSVPVGLKEITVAFSAAMKASTINSTSFTVAGPGTTAIPGAVAYIAASDSAQFTPVNPLPANTFITITVGPPAMSALGAPVVPFSCGFTTAVAPVPPTVTTLAPTCSATGVPINQKVAVTFSEAMDPATIIAANLYLTGPGTTPITGAVTYAAASNIATITPGATLPTSTLITVMVTTGVKDLAGDPMASNFTCSFTTAAAVTKTPPTVISTIPTCNATDVASNTTVQAVFSEPMDPLTINSSTFTLAPTAALTADVSGTVAYAGTANTAFFYPTNNLAVSTSYTLTVTTGAEDLAGNALAEPFSCPFTTGPGVVDTPPTVILTSPLNNATGVALNKTVDITFSKAMDPLTITTANVLLTGPGTTPVTGLVTYDALDDIASFNPIANLQPDTLYTCTVTTGVRDVEETPMVADYVFSFTTAATLGPPTVNLGSAGLFVVLAGAAVTNTGPTELTGDLGLSPGSAVSGFPPGVINGTEYIDDSIAAQAKLDLTTAYNDAAGRTLNVVLISTGQLGGLTLAPGLYRSAPGSFGITGSNLTLDAQGDPNAVFIFQMPSSTLTVGSGIQVILAGGANAANIFWQVGSSATLGTTSIMEGTIMAYASITLDTGAVLNGRALTQIASVTLDDSTVTRPAIAP